MRKIAAEESGKPGILEHLFNNHPHVQNIVKKVKSFVNIAKMAHRASRQPGLLQEDKNRYKGLYTDHMSRARELKRTHAFLKDKSFAVGDLSPVENHQNYGSIYPPTRRKASMIKRAKRIAKVLNCANRHDLAVKLLDSI